MGSFFVILFFSPVFPGLCRSHPPVCCIKSKSSSKSLFKLRVVALQHLPYFAHDEVWPPTVLIPSPHVLIELAAHLYFICSGSGLGLSQMFCISFNRASASSSSVLSLRSCWRSFWMSRLSSSSCFSSWAANPANFSVSLSLLALSFQLLFQV